MGALALAEAQIDREAREAPSTEARAAVAVRDLLKGDRDRAIAMLEGELLQKPEDPRLLNDLAVAHLVRGVEADRPLDLLDALRLSDRATQLNDRRPEPLFNRAYALHLLNLRSQAEAAWRAYLDTDPSDSSWAVMADSYLVELQQPLPYETWPQLRTELELQATHGNASAVRDLIEEFPEASLEAAESWLFSSWADAVLSGQATRADTVLAAIRTVAGALHPEGGRDLLHRALADLEHPPKSTSLESSARAYRNLNEGILAVERFEVGRAALPLETAHTQLSRQDNPYRARALYLLAVCRYVENDYDDAKEMLRSASVLARQVKDFETRAASLQLLGQIQATENQFASALEDQRAAMSLYRRARWKGRQAALEGLLGEMLGFLGDEERSARHRLRALEGIGLVTRPRIRIRIWSDLTSFVTDRRPRVAIYFAEQLVEEANALGLATTSAVALEERASVRAALGDWQGALVDIEAADSWIDQLSNRRLADSMRATTLLLRGEVIGQSDPAGALRVLDETEELLRSTGFEAWLPRLFRSRARSLRAIGDLQHAEEDLRKAAAGLEAAAQSTEDPHLSATVFTEARETYDDLLDLQAAVGWSDRAFEDSERGRWIAGLPPPLSRPPMADSAASLEAETAVVAYWSLPTRTLVWVLRKNQSVLRDLDFSRQDLQKRIVALHRASQAGAIVDPLLEELYRRLVSPVEPYLRGIRTLMIVPDPSLPQVPFVALRDPLAGRYLVEERSVVISPTVSAAVRHRGNERLSAFSSSTSVLAIGNPEPHPDLGLPSLPGAEAEVHRIAALFPRTTLLTGTSASKDSFRELAARHEIVHLAVHTLPNRRTPLLSSLVLAATESDEGLIFSEELIGLGFDNIRLLVISGCGPNASEPGFAGIAGSLLAGGVPAIVAPVWSVADRPTAEVFGRFYGLLRAGASPAAALRASQLELISSSDSELSSPSTWGAFQILETFNREKERE